MYIDLINECIQRNECGGDLACAAMYCSQEITQCTGEEPLPDENENQCSQILDCSSECDFNNITCVYGCIEGYNDLSSEHFLVLRECSSAHSCEDTLCLEENCLNELYQCFDIPVVLVCEGEPPLGQTPCGIDNGGVLLTHCVDGEWVDSGVCTQAGDVLVDTTALYDR